MDSLKDIRKKKGLTQKELADRLGVAQATISAWETGTNKPDMDTIIKLCTILQTTVDDMLSIEEFSSIQKPEVVEEAKSASKMLSAFINLFQSIPPDKLQEMFSLAQAVLPQVKNLTDAQGNPVWEDLTPTIERLISEEVIPWLGLTPEPHREAAQSDSAKTEDGKPDTP
jgi:HK97 family phage major capsid protein